ncbi:MULTISPECIES: NAD(P)/FAD-dependent oxidoreductase [unclassified Streptomyces]|uniref:NAD(P)/FAD-dependent oxidoreductase n=1 Tax=unclassified Streptomyces TaxID=2593676 RepID=UPI000379E95C|nr:MULTISPECIES: NAD(P)/FAD-dependent oxidoreductase [unclassified Streptomyces]MYY01234.1 FAD-dependent oxidoreductase [Streptomyces sp. SID4913]
MDTQLYDTVIVGGGPAGLNAALYLGRSRRRVLLIDSGDARNMAAGVMHNVLTNDGADIADFRARSRTELAPYDVSFRDDEVVSASGDGDTVTVSTKESGTFRTRTLLYAAGVRSILPPLPGIADLWGQEVFECPYCHAWEVRERTIAVYGGSVPSECLASTLTAWSDDLTYLSDGRELPEDERGRLTAAAVPVVTDTVARLERDPEAGVRVVFEDGRTARYGALFLHLDTEPRIDPLRPWVDAADLESVQSDDRGRTRVPRLYVAGDLGRNMHQAAMAAASGGLAGMAINSDLIREDRPGSLPAPPPPAPAP